MPAVGGSRPLTMRRNVDLPAASMDKAVAELGGLDYTFVNAGVAGMGTVLSMPADEWDRVVSVNLRGAFVHAAACGAWRSRRRRTVGAIVLTSSTAGIVSDVGFVHYSVAKIGIRHIARVRGTASSASTGSA